VENFKRIRIRGSAFDRGCQYGEAARDQIRVTLAGYRQTFEAAGLLWEEALAIGRSYVKSIEEFAPSVLQELQGIAHGSKLSLDDILAINCRTEIMASATNRHLSECSAFALAPSQTVDGQAVMGQNWDWLLHAIDSTVLLEVEQDDAPNYVSVVEAGMLAKVVMNSAGIGVAVNTLATSLDGKKPGVPYHILIRKLADARYVYDAIGTLAGCVKASSGNFLVGSADGAFIDVEVCPGGCEAVSVSPDTADTVVHTNHFVAPPANGHDLAAVTMPDSFVRYAVVNRQLSPNLGPFALADLYRVLEDHTDYPGSICCHPDEREPETSRWSTVASIVMDLQQRAFHLTAGRPCETPRDTLNFSDFLSPDSGETTRLVK
jgi:isopenicillin-N N-acyltransferase-like protein